jgi:hypothetical protein
VPHYTIDTANINTNLTVNNTNNDSINNDVNAKATSGDATVADNSKAGNATTGLANTDLTVFNVTGSSVVANNDIMVFVNVLGTWYGMIMNAPAGTTAAEIGGGVSSNTNTNVNDNATLNNTNNDSINNDVKVAANSGDATVSKNTNAGDATSGKATASVNILNMINNSLSLNGWFGMLFINVYGTWNGSFGVNTAAGNPVAPASSGTGGGTSQMFQFVPTATQAGGSNSNATYSNGSGSNTDSTGVVLAAKTVQAAAKTAGDTISPAQKAANRMLLPALGAGLAILILLAGERNRFFRRGN